MNYTNDQLRALLAKMLPETVRIGHDYGIYYNGKDRGNGRVLDTELLHIVSLVEAGLTKNQQYEYALNLLDKVAVHQPFHEGNQCDQDYFGTSHATWQQRTIALAEVKGVTL